MAKGPKYTVKFRREREGKTDYKTRLALLKSKKPRFVIRISNKNIVCQIVEHKKEGDVILASASSKELRDFGWDKANTNLPSAYLVAYLCAKKAGSKKVTTAVLDIGFRDVVAASKPFASLKGALDGGLDIPHDESILPPQERIEGIHIDEKLKAKFESSKKNIDSKF